MAEKWLLLENYSSKKEALVAARVPVIEIQIAEPRAVTGLAFPAENKAQVLEILGLESLQLMETPTNQEGVFLLEPRTCRVSKSGENLEAWTEIKPVLQEFADLLGRDIHVSNPHGKASQPAKAGSGKIHIRFWSRPGAAEAEKTSIAEVFGIRLGDGQRDALTPSGQGIPIVDPDGVVAAEVIEDTIFVLFDLPHKSGNAGQLIRKIMEEYAILQKDPEELERLRAEAREREIRASREAYVRECGRRLESTIAATRRSIEDAERTIRDCQKRITEAVRAQSGFCKKLEQLLQSSAELEKSFAEEFNKLCAVPGVERVRVTDGVVQIFTDNVEIKYGGSVYDIGRFRLDIYTSGSNGGVRAFNLTRTVNGHAHPHVKSDGNCCLGNIADGVAKLIGEYQYSVLAQVMLQYLRTVNPSDWYKNIKNWPLAAEPAEKGGEK